MTERAKCPECGRRVALTKRRTIKAHGQGLMPRDYAGGMVCVGTGSAPLTPTELRGDV